MEIPVLHGERLLGSFREVRRDPLALYERAQRECGDVARLVFGPPGLRVSAIVVSHPDGIHRVLGANSANYGKDLQGYREIRALGGDGLLTSEGARWKRQRRSLTPLFTPQQVMTYDHLMVEEAYDLVERWDAAADRDEPVDLHAEMLGYALRVLGRALLGRRVDHALQVISTGLPILGASVVARGNSPILIPRSWPTPHNRRVAYHRTAIYEVVDDLVDQRRAQGSGGDDLIGSLLRMHNPDTGEPIDGDEIRDQVVIFMIAGHETTATALTFTLHLLGLHPDLQQRVREEALAVLGDRPPTAADMKALPFTATVVKEAMRLYPSVHLLARAAIEEDELLGFRIPKGSTVLAMPWLAHRHPDFWEEPERFDPSRFTPEREKQRHRYAYLPFGGGPRACIGASFATLETILATAIIVRAHRITTRPGTVPLVADFTIRPAQPVPAVVTRTTSATPEPAVTS